MNTVRSVASPTPSNESRNFNGEMKSTFLKPRPILPKVNSPTIASRNIKIMAPAAFARLLLHVLITSTAIATPATPPAM